PVFPTSGNLSSNYWVDVVFTAASGTDLRSITIQQQQTQQQQQLNVNLHKNSVDRFAINELYVNVMPNPSNTFFNLVIKGNNQSLVTVRVFDISGRLIEKQEKIASSSTLQLGYKWISGSYIVEVIQGDQRKFMKIIKVN
ncbi:MAG: T9SS type A sorting domain-containing protein, partial [Chitinophagaceae bacterium]